MQSTLTLIQESQTNLQNSLAQQDTETHKEERQETQQQLEERQETQAELEERLGVNKRLTRKMKS